MTGDRFANKSVMVIGAASGIGLATATRFAHEGANLALFDINPDVHQAAKALRTDVGGSRVFAATCDITDAEACESAVAAAIKEYGALDVLAVVAGVIQQAGAVADLAAAEWDRVLNVNLRGSFLINQAAVRPMIAQSSGRIINVASWWGHSGHAYFAAYCASKSALITLTQALAEEVAGYGITANAICPGFTNTELHQSALRSEAAKRSISVDEMQVLEWGKVPMKRAADPSEIADGILFLASEEAAYVTGASLDVNGGVVFH
jgi:NAD(P)-dependent dehydrogenase (short-subunit alcohol dehydrogenase family)